MKQFIKGRWFPLVVALVCGAGLMGVLFWQGFRITYAPELENSWDAISACAAWAGVIMSFVAIMFAIWVPIRIANRQDKIALFEKRYELYNQLKNHYVFAAMVKKAKNIKYIYLYSETVFGFSFEDSDKVSQLNHATANLYSKVLFLFPMVAEKDFQNVVNAEADYFLRGICNNTDEKAKREEYVSTISKFWSKYDSVFKSYLDMSN